MIQYVAVTLDTTAAAVRSRWEIAAPCWLDDDDDDDDDDIAVDGLTDRFGYVHSVERLRMTRDTEQARTAFTDSDRNNKNNQDERWCCVLLCVVQCGCVVICASFRMKRRAVVAVVAVVVVVMVVTQESENSLSENYFELVSVPIQK